MPPPLSAATSSSSSNSGSSSLPFIPFLIHILSSSAYTFHSQRTASRYSFRVLCAYPPIYFFALSCLFLVWKSRHLYRLLPCFRRRSRPGGKRRMSFWRQWKAPIIVGIVWAVLKWEDLRIPNEDLDLGSWMGMKAVLSPHLFLLFLPLLRTSPALSLSLSSSPIPLTHSTLLLPLSLISLLFSLFYIAYTSRSCSLAPVLVGWMRCLGEMTIIWGTGEWCRGGGSRSWNSGANSGSVVGIGRDTVEMGEGGKESGSGPVPSPGRVGIVEERERGVGMEEEEEGWGMRMDWEEDEELRGWDELLVRAAPISFLTSLIMYTLSPYSTREHPSQPVPLHLLDPVPYPLWFMTHTVHYQLTLMFLDQASFLLLFSVTSFHVGPSASSSGTGFLKSSGSTLFYLLFGGLCKMIGVLGLDMYVVVHRGLLGGGRVRGEMMEGGITGWFLGAILGLVIMLKCLRWDLWKNSLWPSSSMTGGLGAPYRRGTEYHQMNGIGDDGKAGVSGLAHHASTSTFIPGGASPSSSSGTSSPPVIPPSLIPCLPQSLNTRSRLLQISLFLTLLWPILGFHRPLPRLNPNRQIDIVMSYYDEPIPKLLSAMHNMLSVRAFSDRRPRLIIYVKNPDYGSGRGGEREELRLKLKEDTGADEVVVGLKNWGREGGTYLKHILINYNTTRDDERERGCDGLACPLGLAYHTLFMQPHLSWEILALTRIELVEDHTGFLSSTAYLRANCGVDGRGNGNFPRMIQIYETFRKEKCPPTNQAATYSGQAVVSRKRILENDWRDYKWLDDLLEAPPDHPIHKEGEWWKYHGEPGPTNPYLGHALERSWPVIFACHDPTIAESCPDSWWVSRRSGCQCFDEPPLGQEEDLTVDRWRKKTDGENMSISTGETGVRTTLGTGRVIVGEERRIGVRDDEDEDPSRMTTRTKLLHRKGSSSSS